MKRIWMTGAALAVALTAAADEPAKATKDDLKTPAAKFSYAIGMEIGEFLKRMPEKVDVDLFVRALRDVLDEKETLLSKEEAMDVKREFMTKVQAQRAQQAKEAGERNQKEGEAFLAKNAEKEGVVTTASGLQVEMLKEGDGPMPKKSDKVTVHYRGTLLDGSEFDSSYRRGQPATFPLARVIPGWTEGLQLMKVGGKARLVVPSNLGYGERGAPGGKIGPNAVLIFDVELLDIAK